MKVKLNETDPIWSSFKYLQFENTLQQVLGKFQQFYNKHQEEMNKGDLDAMRNMPEFQGNMDIYTRHLNIMNVIKQTREKLEFEKVFAIEQQVATQKQENGQGFELQNLNIKNLEFKEDRIRIALLASLSGSSQKEIEDFVLNKDDLQEFSFCLDQLEQIRARESNGEARKTVLNRD